jgi:hypothetical protein
MAAPLGSNIFNHRESEAGAAKAAPAKQATRKPIASEPSDVPADGPRKDPADSVDCPENTSGPCPDTIKARRHLAEVLERMHRRTEPPPIYHHSNFHSVPLRPPLAPGWMVPGDDQHIRAARTNWTQSSSTQRLPAQRIQITPPPMPEQSPRTTPSAQGKDEVFATVPHDGGGSSGRRSWIFSAPDLSRREPAPIEARRPDYPAPVIRR